MYKNMKDKFCSPPNNSSTISQTSSSSGATTNTTTATVQVKCPLYVTRISGKSASQALSRARLQGYNVFGETLASHIGCTMHDVPVDRRLYYVTSPPIRHDPETPRILLKSLAL